MRSSLRPPIVSLTYLVLLMFFSVWRFRKSAELPLPPDAVHGYLPAAKRLLSEGLPFFLDPESYRIAPLAYAWPALWRADPAVINWVHQVLFLACIWLVWRLANLLGGARAAVVCTLLLVAHPLLYGYFRTVLTEPLFLMSLFVLLLSISEIALGRRWPRWWVAVGATGLAITLLVRPVLQLIAPLALGVMLVLAVRAAKRNNEAQDVFMRIAGTLAFGLIPALIVVVKNGLLFGVWAVATGSGAGLYLGLHPLTQGAEPAYVGLDYDVNAVARLDPNTNGDHVNANANALLGRVAFDMLQQSTLQEHLHFFGRKLWWWLLYHPATLEQMGTMPRTLRLFELGSILVGLLLIFLAWRNGRWSFVSELFARTTPDARSSSNASASIGTRRACVVAGIFGCFVAMTAQLLPVLYNERYSASMLEPWLILVAGCAWGVLLTSISLDRGVTHGRARLAIALSGHSSAAMWVQLLALICLPTLPHSLAKQLRKTEVIQLDAINSLTFTPMMELGKPLEALTETAKKQANGDQWVTLEQPAALVIPVAPTNAVDPANVSLDVWRFRFAVQAERPERCKLAEVGVTRPFGGKAMLAPVLHLKPDGRVHDYLINATHNLRPAADGNLRVVFHCPAGTRVDWKSARMERAAIQQWKRFVHTPPPAVAH